MPYINQLDASKPVATDPVSEGAEEIRNVKETLKDTFPYANSPLNVSNDAIQIALQEALPDMQAAIEALTARVEALESA
jgi:hypothetical protein